MAEKKSAPDDWGKRGYAPDKPSDVAEWWDDETVHGKSLSEMTKEELGRAEAGVEKLKARLL